MAPRVAGWGASDAVSPIRDGAGYHPLSGCKNTAIIFTVNINIVTNNFTILQHQYYTNNFTTPVLSMT